MKTIIFDFDGTLTRKGSNIWKSIWTSLGYDVSKNSFYRNLFSCFMDGKITHQEWCNLTCDAFVKKGMTKKQLTEISKGFHLIDGAKETFRVLKSLGYSLHIVSGNVKFVIERVLGENVKYFDSINANRFDFDENGKLVFIKGTNYDFQGKAKFVNEFKETTGTSAKDICFVGNGGNDEWVHFSGCRTLCINPDDADVRNQTKWHKVLPEVVDLRRILPEIVMTNDKNRQI